MVGDHKTRGLDRGETGVYKVIESMYLFVGLFICILIGKELKIFNRSSTRVKRGREEKGTYKETSQRISSTGVKEWWMSDK